MVPHRRNRSTGDCKPAEAPDIYQSGPEKPSVPVRVASTSPRTKAPCELAGQTQAPLSGRGLGEAQSPPGAFHLTAWASSSSDTVPWASSYSGPITAPCHPLPSSGDPGTQKGKALGSETPAANCFPSLSQSLPVPLGCTCGKDLPVGSGGISLSCLISPGEMEHIRVQKEQGNAAMSQ